ncbi:MAG: transcription termination/antitermination NusG family protein [Hyphomicrobiaceae bacterium]
MPLTTDPTEPPAAWVAVNTHPHKEHFALENLARQEFRTYCPMIRRRVRHARRSMDVLRPMFPGYVFAAVGMDRTEWRPLLSTFGVRSVLRCGDNVSIVPEGFIHALQAREIDGAIARPEQVFHIGQVVTMASGPFDGLVATIVGMDTRDRVTVLLDLLNRPVKVQVPTTGVIERR